MTKAIITYIIIANGIDDLDGFYWVFRPHRNDKPANFLADLLTMSTTTRVARTVKVWDLYENNIISVTVLSVVVSSWSVHCIESNWNMYRSNFLVSCSSSVEVIHNPFSARRAQPHFCHCHWKCTVNFSYFFAFSFVRCFLCSSLFFLSLSPSLPIF